jgi:predicted peroxiredoxin
MATMLMCATRGPEDPVRAVLPFVSILGSLERHSAGCGGHQVLLLADAVLLVRHDVAASVRAPGYASAAELMQRLLARGVSFEVSDACAQARGITEQEVTRMGGRLSPPRRWARLMEMDSTNVVTF